nr:Chain C, Peptide ALA-SER-LEU-ASN-LEU-PRO-ALA-VAL-SER-TRP [synthetic construct]6V2P_C Chain C, Peptide ALA-SER-LEU-ASN-LEU-PRO-ALA-VAL-SER-TRP [synthetic construct]
ASLNLPAVSW